MKIIIKLALMIAIFAGCVQAQFNFPNPLRSGPTLPAICRPGSLVPALFVKTSAGPASQVYQCSSTNTWTLVGGSGSGTVTTISGSGPSWLTWTIANPTTTPAISLAPTTGQSSHQVIGTCGAATIFGPCNIVAGDLPSTAVTPGTYTLSTVTVDQQGRITSASSGSSSGTPGGSTDDIQYNTGSAFGGGRCTMTSGGNIICPGSITAVSFTTTGVTNTCTTGTAGCIQLGQGTAPSALPTTAIQEIAPTAVTSYRKILVGSVSASGIPHYTYATSPVVQITESVSPVSLTADINGTLAVANGGTGITSFGTGVATALGTAVSGSGAICLATGSACGTGGTGTSVTSTTPVTVNTNTTSDQQLMELSLGAGYFNSSKQPFLFDGAGVYTTQTAQTPTITLKIKLCTVSGCGSGTVVTLINIVSTATIAAVSNNNWNLSVLGYTATTGATGNLEIHGPLAVDLGALTTTADSIFVDTNTAVSSNIDLTAALFVDFTIAFSTNAVTANTFTQRSGGVMPFAATAAPVTSVFGQTGAVGNLTGDCTTSGSTATKCLPGTTVPGTSVTLAGSSQIFICTSTCTITVPVPSLNVQYCVMNDDNVSTVITLSAIGSSARYENTARTAYGTAGTGTFISGGAVGDAVCIVGRDATHYLTVSHTGTWTAN